MMPGRCCLGLRQSVGPLAVARTVLPSLFEWSPLFHPLPIWENATHVTHSPKYGEVYPLNLLPHRVLRGFCSAALQGRRGPWSAAGACPTSSCYGRSELYWISNLPTVMHGMHPSAEHVFLSTPSCHMAMWGTYGPRGDSLSVCLGWSGYGSIALSRHARCAHLWIL